MFKTLPVVALVVLAGALLTQPAAAKFPCDKKWSGPSPNNKIEDCEIAEWYAEDNSAAAAAFIVPLIFFVFTLFGIPFVCAARHCCQCCGASKRRPGNLCGCGFSSEADDWTKAQKEAAYSRGSVRYAKLSTVFLIALGVCTMIMLLVGTTDMYKAYDSFFDDVNGLGLWIKGKADRIQAIMTRSDGTIIPPLTTATFNDIRKKADDLVREVDDAKEDSDKVVKPVRDSAYSLATVGFALLCLPSVCAFLNIRKIIPSLIIFVLWLVTFLMFICAAVLLLSHSVTKEVCDEIDAHKANPTREPGILQWLVVPECQSNANFDSTRAEVQAAERNAAGSACTEFRRICDASAVYNGVTPDIVYQCSSTPSTCTTFAQANTLITQATIKTGVPTTVGCPNTNTPCTLSRCAAECQKAEVKSISLTANSSITDATKAFTAYTQEVAELLDCNFLVDKALEPFGQCTQLERGFQVAGGGAFMYGFAGILAVIMLFRGQKRFFARSDGTGVKSEPTKDRV